MSHIPHYGTPGFSSHPSTHSPHHHARQSPAAAARRDPGPGPGLGSPGPLGRDTVPPTAPPRASPYNQSPLSLSLRKNLPLGAATAPPDSPLLDEMDVRLPSVTRDPVTTFQRLMALRQTRAHKGLFVDH